MKAPKPPIKLSALGHTVSATFYVHYKKSRKVARSRRLNEITTYLIRNLSQRVREFKIYRNEILLLSFIYGKKNDEYIMLLHPQATGRTKGDLLKFIQRFKMKANALWISNK